MARMVWTRRSRGVVIGVAVWLMATSWMADAPPTHASQRTATFAGAPFDTRRAQEMAATLGADLLDFRPCSSQGAGCIELALRVRGREPRVIRLIDRPCTTRRASCVGGYTVVTQLGGPRSQPQASAKLSGKPGPDGAPSDTDDDAEAAATNEIIEALADGLYADDYDRFWRDLESIQTWTTPTWLEPASASDRIRLTGGNDTTPAVLISGRQSSMTGATCRAWVSYTSTGSTIEGLGNWMDGERCDSEVAVFSENGGAHLAVPEPRWSQLENELTYTLGPTIKVPTTVWVISSPAGYTGEVNRLTREFSFANTTLASSRCGIELVPTYIDRTTTLADPTQELGCASIETTLKQVGFHPKKMNVYMVNALIADTRAGVACLKESDNVIILDPGRNATSVLHEFGHWFDLSHTTGMPLVNVRNIMSMTNVTQRDTLTAGQCYRANFSRDSYINTQGLRTGPTKACRHAQDADGRCPGLKNEF